MSDRTSPEMAAPGGPPTSLRRRVWSSGGWALARTAINAVTQFATLIVLLRLLDSSDFGVLSVVMVVLTLTQAFTQTGVDLALVRQRGDITPWLAPFFTLQATRGFLLGGLVCALAIPISLWQGSPVLADYLFVASLVPILEGLRGVSSLIYVRDLEQRVPTLIDGSCSVLSFCSLTALALWLRSPWAVILNQLFATGLRSLAYHLCHPVRTPLTWKWGSLRPFCRFGLGYNLAQTSGTLIDTFDRLLIGRHLGLSTLGLYDRSAALANYGLYLLPQFFSTVMFPAFSGIAEDRAKFWRVARKYLLWVAFGGCVLAGLARAGDRFLLPLVAGERASELLPFFRILLLCALLRGIAWVFQALFDVLGKPQLRAIVNGVHTVVIVSGLFWVLASGELWQACVVALVGGAVSAAMSVAMVYGLARSERVAPATDETEVKSSPGTVPVAPSS